MHSYHMIFLESVDLWVWYPNLKRLASSFSLGIQTLSRDVVYSCWLMGSSYEIIINELEKYRSITAFTCAPSKSCVAAMFSLTPAKLAFSDGYSWSEYTSTLFDILIPLSCIDIKPELNAVKSFNKMLKCLSAQLILSDITFNSWSLEKILRKTVSKFLHFIADP